MLSFQAHPLSPNQKKTIPDSENSSKKRKWDDKPYVNIEQLSEKRSKVPQCKPNSLFDIELHLETPLPSEWQRCLDIQSGQIHFYNTRTQMKTSRDPRRSPEPPTSPAADHHHHHMSLDLELNLRSCDQSRANSDISTHSLSDLFMESHRPIQKNPNNLGFPVDRHHQQQQEMVATVCIKCHMLVMLCRSSPACPNCKYMHAPDQSPPTLFNFKPRCTSSFMC
ncbi:hypothetical protein D8674_012984 [Pyrus ussuriensis x Pyrus communis]|uniref:WW domain-containing protein n=1 Tax=Pyrus ussuriensis x Pyrus communis TaxID=2448454 RepID=A0A5N5GNG4_9ROSA|nr:hypothetical protein D8674_012984 [Pyrus ussuriensis x Pyrus communis]